MNAAMKRLDKLQNQNPKLSPNKKPAKRKAVTSSSSDGDEIEPLSDDEATDPLSADHTVEVAADLNLDEFHKRASENEPVHIQMESLPPLTTTEHEGQLYEIEVIDQINRTQDTKSRLKMADMSKQLAGSSLQECGESSSSAPPTVKTKQATSDGTVTLKKKEKRDQKKTALKSKFKRLGMLPVANFDDTSMQSPRGKGKSKK